MEAEEEAVAEVAAEAVEEVGEAEEESVSPAVLSGFRGSEKRLEETDIVQEYGFPPFCRIVEEMPGCTISCNSGSDTRFSVRGGCPLRLCARSALVLVIAEVILPCKKSEAETGPGSCWGIRRCRWLLGYTHLSLFDLELP